MNSILPILIAFLFISLSLAPPALADSGEPVESIKKAGKAVGKGVSDGARSIKGAVQDVTEDGQAFKKIGKEIGNAGEEVGDMAKRAGKKITGKGESGSSRKKP